jgi:hypothetical protein
VDYRRQQEAASSSYSLFPPLLVDAALNSESFGSKEIMEPIPEGVLMVWDGVRDLEVGVVVKLGMKGLAFEYFGQRLPLAEVGRLDLMTDSGLYLDRVPYELLYSESVEEEEDPSPVPIRRAVLKIGKLTAIQRTAFETLIAIYATPKG